MQREQRVDFFQALFGLLALNALRLVNNQDMGLTLTAEQPYVTFGNGRGGMGGQRPDNGGQQNTDALPPENKQNQPA